jgi:hypothetical protein
MNTEGDTHNKRGWTYHVILLAKRYILIEPRVQTIKAKQDIWTGGPESLGASWMTEKGKYPELYAFFPIGHLMELAHKFASSLDISEK